MLDGGKEEGEVEYRPKRIDMGGSAYPSELKGAMWFKAERTPNFVKYLLSLLYKKTDEGEKGKEEMTEQQPEGKEKLEEAASAAL